jgi:hypothetical protein
MLRVLHDMTQGTYAGLRAVFVRHYAGNMIEIRVPGGLIVVDRQHFKVDMTLSELFDTTTIVNPDDGLTVTVTPVARGWLVRMVDDDSGQRMYPLEADAIAYAHKIAGVDPWLRLGGIA